MSKLKERLSRATYKSTRVEICLDGDLRDQRDLLLPELRAAQKAREAFEKSAENGGGDERLGQKHETEIRLERAFADVKALEAQILESLLVIEVRALPGDQWSRLRRKHPVPEKNTQPIDRQFGCNTEAVTMEALIDCGYLVVDEDREPLSAGDVDDLRKTITEGDFDRIRYAILQLNQSDGFQGVGHLKGASSVTPASDTK